MKSTDHRDPLANAHIEVLDGFFSVEPAPGEEDGLKGYLFSTIKENISLVSDNKIQLSVLRFALSQPPRLFNRSLDKLYGLLQLNRCPPARMLALVKSLKKINDFYHNNELRQGLHGLKAIYKKFRFNTRSGNTSSAILSSLVRAYLDDKVDQFIKMLFLNLAVESVGEFEAVFNGVPSYTAWRQQDETLSTAEYLYHHYTNNVMLQAESGDISNFQQYFTQLQVDVNSIDSHGETALMRASFAGDVAVVNALFNVGANVNAANQHGSTALMCAAINGHIALVRRLLAAREINVNARDSDGVTALMLTAINSHVAVINVLLRAGANVNTTSDNGDTALMLATNYGHTAVVQLLLQVDSIDVNAKNRHGDTALMLAAENGHDEVVNALLSAGVTINTTNSLGLTALMCAVIIGHVAVVVPLLKVPGINLNARDSDGSTALVLAAENGHGAVVKLLLLAGANVHLRDHSGRSALDYAQQNRKTGIVALLNQYLALQTSDDTGDAPPRSLFQPQ